MPLTAIICADNEEADHSVLRAEFTYKDNVAANPTAMTSMHITTSARLKPAAGASLRLNLPVVRSDDSPAPKTPAVASKFFVLIDPEKAPPMPAFAYYIDD